MNKNYTGYNVEELLNDEYFIQWLLAPDVENERYWNELREKVPGIEVRDRSSPYSCYAFTTGYGESGLFEIRG